MATVETRALTKRFETANAVDGIDLAVREGEFLVLLGPSGCGKTTLLRMLAGLETPSAGEVLIGGRTVTHLPPRARNIAMVFQSYALYPHLSVYRNIAFPLAAVGMPRHEVADKVAQAASMFGIERLLERKPRQLSGGERQRVALARALLRDRPVLLLDEAFASLGPALRREMLELVRDLDAERRMTILMVTHHPGDARALCHRIAFVEEGRVAAVAPTAEMFSPDAPEAFRAYIGA